jgi:hypothetical protein
MLPVLQICVLFLVALAMVPAVAHALELPGKLRLSMGEYLVVQPIYYPGFTIVGFAEFAAIPATFGLLFVVPQGSSAFWLTLSALIALLIMHAVFWIFTQPVNRIWLRKQELSGASASFFATGAGLDESKDWRALRNRWEWSHVVRGVLALAALMLSATAIAAS